MKTDSPADHLALLRQFQAWRLGDDEIAQPEPREITASLDWAIAVLSEEENKTCKWEWLDDDEYCHKTSCGNVFMHDYGETPSGLGMNFCPFCGHKIEEAE